MTRTRPFLMLSILSLAMIAHGQDSMRAIDIVGEMELSPKSPIANEAASKKASIDSLKSQVADLRTNFQSPDVMLSRVANPRFDTLESRFAQLSSGSDLRTMPGQPSSLIAELKNTIEESKKALEQPLVGHGLGTPTMKVGILAQMYGQALQEQTTAKQDTTPGFDNHWDRQLFVRRLRVLLGGELSSSTSFFVESDAPNIGKVEASGLKPTKVSMYMQDAYIQQTVAPELSVIAGLQLVGITRNSLQSAASLMALDYGSYQFLTSTPFDNSAGRDLGLNLRGFLLDERLEYRAGLFSGKNQNPYSPFRTVVRLNYMFEDKEKGFFYSGTTLAKGKLLSVGGGLDAQGQYRGYSVDAMADLPLTPLGSITASGSCTLLDGGGSATDSTFFTGAIPRQFVVFAELGYFFREYGLQPYVKFESETVDATDPIQVGATPSTLDFQNKLRSKSRYGAGLNYYISGHNASVKILFERASRYRQSLDPSKYELASNSELSIQFQYFWF